MKTMQMRKNHPIFKIMNNLVIDLPSPTNISIWWNFGSLLGLCLIIQIMSGLFLSMHYTSDTSTAFSSIIHITRNVNNGWMLRNIHANGASMFFICLYIHISRGIYYQSFLNKETWITGLILLFMTMATAFIGYVLPWGQMSFWGATVITNLLSATPYLGDMMVQWIWGGFAIDNATLTRFFALHFILPFLITAMAMIHLMFLHQKGSSNPLGLQDNMDKIPFHPYFSLKDMVGFIIMINMLLLISLNAPNLLSDPENFIPANSLVTPTHIQPEWYFLFAYAILRSIPNKLGGVVALLMSILIFMILPFNHISKFKSLSFNILSQLMFWSMLSSATILTWIGMQPVEEPFIFMGQITTMIYFSFFLMYPPMNYMWETSHDYTSNK